MNRHEKQQTFQHILTEVAQANAAQLMNKARTANKLAKAATTRTTRLGAYRVKHNALMTLKERFPQRVTVSNDPNYGSFFVIVQVSDARFGLHAPAHQFAKKAA